MCLVLRICKTKGVTKVIFSSIFRYIPKFWRVYHFYFFEGNLWLPWQRKLFFSCVIRKIIVLVFRIYILLKGYSFIVKSYVEITKCVQKFSEKAEIKRSAKGLNSFHQIFLSLCCDKKSHVQFLFKPIILSILFLSLLVSYFVPVFLSN